MHRKTFQNRNSAVYVIPKNKKIEISRREFFKRILEKSGYIIPTVMVFKSGSTNAWAESYKKRNDKKSRDECKGFLEQIFDPSCW